LEAVSLGLGKPIQSLYYNSIAITITIAKFNKEWNIQTIFLVEKFSILKID
jgi:hypothetical protein